MISHMPIEEEVANRPYLHNSISPNWVTWWIWDSGWHGDTKDLWRSFDSSDLPAGEYCTVQAGGHSRARFLSLARGKLRLCSANHRAGYFSNLACDWLSIVWAYSEQETENGPRFCRRHTSKTIGWIYTIRNSIDLSTPIAVLGQGLLPNYPIGDLPLDQTVVKSGTSGVQTLRNRYVSNHWTG